MNGPLYPNQPLVEVATEVRFKGDLTIEKVRSEYQNKIRDNYPLLLVAGAQEGIAPALQPYRFEKNNQTSGIQLAINSFSYYSKKYPGHEIFLDEIKYALTALSEVLQNVGVTRIGWRYINAMPFTRENKIIPLHRFFKDNSILGDLVKRDFFSINHHAQMPTGNDLVTISLESSSAAMNSGVEKLLLDIDSFRVFDEPLSKQTISVFDEISELHGVAYNIFEAVISENYREFLKGENNE